MAVQAITGRVKLLMHDLPLRFRSFVQTERPLRYYLEAARGMLQLLVVPSLAVGTLLFGIVSGLLATKLTLEIALMALAGLAIVFIAFSRPEFAILLILVSKSSIFDPQSLRINIGFNFTLIELYLIFLLGLVVARALSNKEDGFVRTPLDWPVFLFFMASILSFFNAMYNLGTDRGLLMRIWRLLFDYMLFFAVTNLVRTRRQLMTLVGSILVMTTLVAALVVAQGVVGRSVQLMPAVTVGTATALDREFANVARVTPPGTPLLFIMLLPALILHTTPEYLQTRKWLSLIPLLIFPPAIAFTFNRTWTVGAVFSLILLIFFIRPASQRQHILKTIYIIAVILSVSLGFLRAYVPTKTENFLEALSFRAGSLFVGEDRLREDQERRLCEIESAKATIQERPLLGVGPGGPIHTKMCLGYKDGNFVRYVHNAYLFILADLGLFGFLPFLWFSASYLFRGFSVGRTLKDPTLRGWVFGLTLGYIALLIASISGPEFMSWHTAPVVGVMLGVNEVAIRLGQSPA